MLLTNIKNGDHLPTNIKRNCVRTYFDERCAGGPKSKDTVDNGKLAQVIPVDKKKDPLDKHNYRPIRILPFVSKLYERSINLQLSAHFENFFNPFLGALRQGMGCQSTLLRLVENWRGPLDRHEYVSAVLMDLSKAFDCIPHVLLLVKLQTYGLSDKACALISSYLSGRRQQVRLGHIAVNGMKSSRESHKALSYSHNKPNSLKHHLQVDCVAILQWFKRKQHAGKPRYIPGHQFRQERHH